MATTSDAQLTAASSFVTTNASGNLVTTPTTAAVPTWVKVTKDYSDLATAAPTNTITLTTLPAGGVVHAVKIKHSTAFSGGSITSYTVEVGITGDTDKYALAYDVFQATGAATYQLSAVLGGESHTATTDLKLTATASHDLDTATDGAVDIWLLLSTPV